ncbi:MULTISPECIES: sigma-70 family RNA polymerase sigma factor [Pontibacillus]|uniref:Sigma-70 family RNA polymerase sigma factor n=1 Tax=Pontibacillus chungwhensis TaxID=265426 RepID=A0ABY8UYH9_9BACI|nr:MULTISPECIES: sigma-70 family RNA polymerase sigma factor [Pontibacillus]MCD5324757.1 sigma-70 family RNA polymerase sigma factor [Pontibacillus sp. HN14]WIF98717.1 sigma-70 family RNA polymerase sigma factor [Pontibacillus chungwhensis]
MNERYVDGEWVTAEDLIRKHRKFIWKQVKKYIARGKGAGFTPDDLYSCACIGVMKAFDSFDAEKGYKFLTYAGTKMMGQIDAEIRKNSGLIHLPALQDQLVRKIKAEDMVEKNAEETAKHFEVKLEHAELAKQYLMPRISTETPINEEGDTTLGDFLVGDSFDESVVVVNDFLETLTDLEKDVLLMKMESRTVYEIGDKYNKSRGWPEIVINRVKKKYVKYYKEVNEVAQGNLAKAKQLLSETDIRGQEVALEVH